MNMGLKVIGVGLPRTGTTSLATALAELLNCYPAKIHHGMKLQSLTDKQLNFWLKCLKNQVTDEEIREYFQDFQAALDIPVILIWKDLQRIYPEAKFILTVRDAEAIFESWHKTIGESLRVLHHPIYRWFLNQNHLVTKVHTAAREFIPSWAEMSINQAFSSVENIQTFCKTWNEAVISSIPSENLLVLDVREKAKWEKLCKFLGSTTVPQKAFPKANDSLTFSRQIEDTRSKVTSKFCKGVVIALSVMSLTYLTFQLSKSSKNASMM